MSQNRKHYKRFTEGDRRTSIADTLYDANGNPIDLTGSTVAFHMVLDSDDSVKVNSAAATVDDADAGQVSYAWGASDLDTPGTYAYWWIVTTGGKTEHFPGDGKQRLLVVEPAY